MDGICFIVGAGSFSAEIIDKRPGDYLIAADGGYEHIKRIGLVPDLTLGDFDSMAAPPETGVVERFPAQKDDTDMMLALKRGLSMGYLRFAIYGGLGGRLDHTLANTQALAYLSKRGACAFLVGDGMVLTAITDGELCIPAGKAGTVSVFGLGDCSAGVTLEGLKFPLENAILSFDRPLGVSNAFTGRRARIAVSKGTLLILWYEDDFSPRTAF